jgi:hypothetical protein
MRIYVQQFQCVSQRWLCCWQLFGNNIAPGVPRGYTIMPSCVIVPARPFFWTADPDRIIENVSRGYQA